jgi:DNA primase catalytic core
MSLHKLTAGSGYDYLTRQVAVQDSTEKGHTSLASYYSEKGEAPGRWVGSGLANLEGLSTGDEVTAEQMKALFAYGFHPLADERRAALEVTASAAQVAQAQPLGTPFKVYDTDVPVFHVEVARRLGELNVASGRQRDDEVSVDERARMRTEVATEAFKREHGRDPANARELAATVAKLSRPRTAAVAGFDLTFSPVKSVSALWALADQSTAAAIERAHDAAVREALLFIEAEALYTRTGPQGARQVDVTGLVAASFTHRDSRAGDPDLHTHVAVANKVQTLDGRWLAIDGRVLFKANVSASETYNTALERRLVEALGVRFLERPGSDARKRPVREIVGVDPELNARWSSRRISIEARRSVLAAQFQTAHGRPPSPSEAIALAQQATLETRDAKHASRSLGEQRGAWREQAADVLGSDGALDRMVAGALFRHESARSRVTAQWVSNCAETVLSQVQQCRATWQIWHLHAEAQRQVRGADVAADHLRDLVKLVVDAAVARSVVLATDRDTIREPADQRRVDGSSVYHVAGSDLFTSQAILDAEQRIVDAAGRVDGARVLDTGVDLAVAECAVNGAELNAGQAGLVRAMATSGRRVQLGIAAAGTGKTTAMSALTRAWEDGGGNVIGLAPSAAAAAALGDQTGATTDTLAKLIHALGHPRTGDMPNRVGAGTLLLVDEAGMADTISLDRAISFALDRGASVRLIGDDQQLAAIGAGGVLRDIRTQHGCLQLSELLRFSDPAEGAATLALRDGLPEATGFYLDLQRLDVGDLTTETDAVFNAWNRDTAAGLDSIMLAPTRALVADLNARARQHRIADAPPQRVTVRLADGNDASMGDVVIARHNDRRMRVSATDWVKNGDRWTVTDVRDGALSALHASTGLRVTLPAEYVAQHTELGYASTVHTAQGISVDTMHGLATGDETRQQLYTMMTRGRHENHLYLVTVGDGAPSTLVRPETVHPPTATDIFKSMLARDGSATSATTAARQAGSAAHRLTRATARYSDSLYEAAEKIIGPRRVQDIEQATANLLPGLLNEPAWPALRCHLLFIEASGHDAIGDLTNAVEERELDGVDDRAAILDWRLDPTGMRGTTAGPVPWLPAIPAMLARDSTWGGYLQQRSTQVADLAATVKAETIASTTTPTWAQQGAGRPTNAVLADIAVWRAANGVDAADRRPTGRPQRQKALAVYQRRLEERITGGRPPALAEWGSAIDKLITRRDAFTPLLAERLAAISRCGVNASALLRAAADEGPLPDEHAAAATWWRISRHLSPTHAVQATEQTIPVVADWSELLIDTIGEEHAAHVTSSPWWPSLVTAVEHASQRGWAVTDLLDLAPSASEDIDPAQALLWRIAIVTDPPTDDTYDETIAPDPLFPDTPPDDVAEPVERVSAELTLAHVALDRDLLDPLEPSERDVAAQLDHAYQWDHSPVTGPRILQINELATRFFEHHYDGSWAQLHLHERLGHDVSGDQRFRPGHAPAGWTNLVHHLRAHGVSDTEMLAAGVATTASTGRLIDRFRDRAILPVISSEQVLGFVGRRHPDAHDGTNTGPKYLNTADTIAFRKGAQLYGLPDDIISIGAVPVLVEGPIDAIAVTIASAGAFVGVAPLGTSLTREQATQLASFDRDPIIATDGDLAGRIAAERDYWLLTPHLLDPLFARFPAGQDPAGLLEIDGAAGLLLLLQRAQPLADALTDDRFTNLTDPSDQLSEALQVIAARPTSQWAPAIETIADTLGLTTEQVNRTLSVAANHFNIDRRAFSTRQLDSTALTRERLESADGATHADRWATLAQNIDARLLSQPDWPATAQMLQQIHDSGQDVSRIAQQLVANDQLLDDQPARDLRYRIVGYLPDRTSSTEPIEPAQATKTRNPADRSAPTPPGPRPSDAGPSR